MSTCLLIDGPGMWAYNVELKKMLKLTIGRARQNELVLKDDRVSGKHAVILWEETCWRVRDLGSSNGTLVNGMSVQESELRDGDRLKVGNTDILFKDKATRIADDAWDATVMRMSRHEVALRGAIERSGKNQKEEVVVIPDLHLAPATEVVDLNPGISPGGTPSEIYENMEFNPDRFVAKKTEQVQHGPTPDDMLWVAEKLANILGELAKQKDRSKTQLFSVALACLKKEINIENGFLMIPNRETKRWVIEAWVGNNKEWTTYEKQHPVPLTVANDAFKTGEIVSNVYGQKIKGVDASESLMQLKVQSYIAVPLRRKGEKAGLIYLDMRKALRTFTEREVQLIERVGNYVLELDNELSD